MSTPRNPASRASRVYQKARRSFLAKRSQARAARRLASRTAQVELWWSAMPQPRPTFYTPLALSSALGQPLRRVAAALRWLGWQKIRRRVHGKQVALWLPPSSPVTRRRPGRPRLYAPWF